MPGSTTKVFMQFGGVILKFMVHNLVRSSKTLQSGLGTSFRCALF